MRASGSSRPTIELPFAGHPTLGTAFVLAAPMQLEEIRLETGRGVVPVRLEREGARIVLRTHVAAAPDLEPYAAEAELFEIARDRAFRAAGRALRQRHPARLRRAGIGGRRRPAPTRLRAARRPTFLPRRQLLRRFRAALEDAHVRARARRPRGPGHRLRRRPARAAPRAPRPDRLRRRDRDLAGRRDRSSVDALRARRRLGRAVEAVEVGGSAVVVARGEFRLP